MSFNDVLSFNSTNCRYFIIGTLNLSRFFFGSFSEGRKVSKHVSFCAKVLFQQHNCFILQLASSLSVPVLTFWSSTTNYVMFIREQSTLINCLTRGCLNKQCSWVKVFLSCRAFFLRSGVYWRSFQLKLLKFV